MRYIFIVYLFCVININIFIYIFGQTLDTLTKNWDGGGKLYESESTFLQFSFVLPNKLNDPKVFFNNHHLSTNGLQ